MFSVSSTSQGYRESSPSVIVLSISQVSRSSLRTSSFSGGEGRVASDGDCSPHSSLAGDCDSHEDCGTSPEEQQGEDDRQ